MHKGLSCIPLPHRDDSAVLKDQPPAQWRYKWPNLSDSLQFNYGRLLAPNYKEDTGLAEVVPGKECDAKVAVIGAGLAGSVAVRELTRSGAHVTLIEASNRLGGRTYSDRAPDPSNPKVSQLQVYEQGAMRIPFFNTHQPVKPGLGPWLGGPYNYGYEEWQKINSVNEFYTLLHGVYTSAFADPGKAPGPDIPNVGKSFPGVSTGVFISEGLGVDVKSIYTQDLPTNTFMYQWPAETDPDPRLNTWPGVPAPPTKQVIGPNWPVSPIWNKKADPSNEADFVCFHDHYKANGEPVYLWAPNGDGKVDGKSVPRIKLGHAIPRTDDHIPPELTTESDINAWRMGVTSLRSVLYKWTIFASITAWAFNGTDTPDSSAFTLDGAFIEYFAGSLYNGDNWENWWRECFMKHYQNMNFYELTVTAPILPTKKVNGKWQFPEEWKNGNFGGLGMSTAESNLFYSIGAGDGGWGPFFPNAALWALRSLLFAFASQHQQIIGVCARPNGETLEIDPTLPECDLAPLGQKRKELSDKHGHTFLAPQYAGVNSWSDMNLFATGSRGSSSKHQSFWQMVQNNKADLWAQTRVRVIAKNPATGKITLKVQSQVGDDPALNPLQDLGPFDDVICTIPIWNASTDITWTGFTQEELPISVHTAMSNSHWIRAAKVFVATKKPYWVDKHDVKGPDGKVKKMAIPQDLSLNNELMGWYGQAVPDYKPGYDKGDNWPATGGAALISYTFEDDSQKFLAYNDKELATMLVQKADASLEAMGFGPGALSAYLPVPLADLAEGQYSVFRWSLKRNYHGCARAFQQGIEDLNYDLLTYNKAFGRKSRLFFAGDAYSMESGWSEPAVRMGLDAALHVLSNEKVYKWSQPTQRTGFRYERDYKTANPYSVTESATTKFCGHIKLAEESAELPSGPKRGRSGADTTPSAKKGTKAETPRSQRR